MHVLVSHKVHYHNRNRELGTCDFNDQTETYSTQIRARYISLLRRRSGVPLPAKPKRCDKGQRQVEAQVQVLWVVLKSGMHNAGKGIRPSKLKPLLAHKHPIVYIVVNQMLPGRIRPGQVLTVSNDEEAVTAPAETDCKPPE